MHNSARFAVLVFVSMFLSAWGGTVDASNELRSAYLGPSVWEQELSSHEINLQLREHFVEVIARLEAKNASSLLTALIRAETSSSQRWTKAERKQALIFLANNRQTQIANLREYLDRGLFPINEGQSHQAAPIFVDRHQTHCAVGYLMHVSGSDSEVAEVVATNNLVKVMDAQPSGLSSWVRTSGLTLEEAALIQPGYPLDLNATFDDLATGTDSIEVNGLVLTNATIRGSRFNATLPTSFVSEPAALQTIFEQGIAEIETNDIVTPETRRVAGVLFGMGEADPDYFQNVFDRRPQASPGNLDDWLYVGSTDAVFGGLVGNAQPTGNVGIVEIEYTLRSQRGNFSEIALTSFSQNDVSGEQSALLILSQIYEASTNELLGQSELSVTGTAPNVISPLVGSASVQLDTDAVTIRNYGLVVGGGDLQLPLHSFFNEFQTVAIPEPATATVLCLLGGLTVLRRKR